MTRPAPAVFLAVALAVALVVAAGVWLAGRSSDDAGLAMAATAGWLLVAGVAAALLAWRRRAVAVPVIAGFLVSAGGLGAFLLVTSSVDRVADEQVVLAVDATTVAAGTFTDGAHPTSGTATLSRLSSGGHVLTLTGFATDPGPDLRVYLGAGDGADVEGALDLGALAGNKGDQQYALPDGWAPPDGAQGAVVIWCRAFDVAFGSAVLSRS